MIEKSVFTSRIAKSNVFTLKEKLDIQNAKKRYPYCALLQKLDLLSDKAANIYHWEERFTRRVALHMPDPQRLLADLRNVKEIDISTPADLRMKQEIEDAKSDEYKAIEEDAAFDVLNAINSYEEVSFKTAPKSVILEKFLEESNVDTSDMPDETPEKVIELGKKSIKANDALDTETLALILEKQKKFDMAISVYQKLITRNPEKSSTFAPRIEKLKKELENNKK